MVERCKVDNYFGRLKSVAIANRKRAELMSVLLIRMISARETFFVQFCAEQLANHVITKMKR